jgi:uncharacterized membrane protein YbhN (UPF0104 family)
MDHTPANGTGPGPAVRGEDGTGDGATPNVTGVPRHGTRFPGWMGHGRRWRAIVFAPVGDGQTRRRGSDGVRVGLAVLALLVCWVITRANSNAEHAVATSLSSPPQGIRWLISTIWWITSLGVIAIIAIMALLSRRWSAIRDVAVSGLGAWLICVIATAVFGSTGGRPPTSSYQHFDLSFPVARVAATVGVVTAALPYLSRWMQRTLEAAIVLLGITAVVNGSGLPISVVASLAVGWGVTALVHLIFGSPLGLPSTDEVELLLQDLEIAAVEVSPNPRQEWGVGRFSATADGSAIDVSVYGRDASDAQLLAKTARFLFYRDSGPTLALTRRQQVEHEAYLTLMADRSGARVPTVLAAGPAGPARDALLVTRPPRGRRLSAFAAYVLPATPVVSASEKGDPAEDGTSVAEDGTSVAEDGTSVPEDGTSVRAEHRGKAMAGVAGSGDATLSGDAATDQTGVAHDEPVAVGDADGSDNGSDGNGLDGNGPDGNRPDPVGPVVSDAGLDAIFEQLSILRRAGIAHGALSIETIVVDDDDRAGMVDFRTASTVATADQLDRDTAATLAAMAVVAGPERTMASATRSVAPGVVVDALPYLQRAALDTVASRTLRGKKSLLVALREQGAGAMEVDVPKLIEPRRVSWVNLALVAGTLIGGWALIGVLINVTKSWSTITGAAWGWVAVTFVLAQAAYPAIAVTTVGSVTNPLPYGRTVALELSDTFVALAGGSMAVLATRVRFFQQEGYTPTVAVSSGVLVSTASWIVKGALFLIALPLAIGNLHFKSTPNSDSSSNSHLVWLIVVVVVAVGVALGLVFAIPRWRRLAAAKLRPKASEVWSHLKLLAGHPRNLVEIFGGSAAAQIFVALALGASLHAFGDRLDLSTLIVVLTLGSMLGGISPVPGGMGVVEAGMIIGLTAAGINESDAVAAVFVQRLFTAYLPPIWGWFVLVWMRKKEYL